MTATSTRKGVGPAVDHEPPAVDITQLRNIRASELSLRFGVGAAISVFAALVAIAFGPIIGGLFLAFPAILPAALTIVEKREGRDSADEDAMGAVPGAVGMMLFAAACFLLIPRVAAAVALGLALAAWLALGTAGWLALQRMLPDRREIKP